MQFPGQNQERFAIHNQLAHAVPGLQMGPGEVGRRSRRLWGRQVHDGQRKADCKDVCFHRRVIVSCFDLWTNMGLEAQRNRTACSFQYRVQGWIGCRHLESSIKLA